MERDQEVEVLFRLKQRVSFKSGILRYLDGPCAVDFLLNLSLGTGLLHEGIPQWQGARVYKPVQML